MTTNETSTKKSTRIDVAPERLRTIAHQEMMLAGFSVEMRKPIWDGHYDLEHLQATYETAVGLGRDAAASAIAALAAWARVYPEGHGSEKRLTGGVELYMPRDGAVILGPTGIPFPVVGTALARRAIGALVGTANDHPDVEEMGHIEISWDEATLCGLLAHRDHLHAQVTDLQHTATRFQIEARTWQAMYMGVEARVLGKARTDIGMRRDDPLREAWEQGYDFADQFAESVVKTVREVDKYAPKTKPEPMPLPGNGRNEGP